MGPFLVSSVPLEDVQLAFGPTKSAKGTSQDAVGADETASRRKRKWREIRRFHFIASEPPYRFRSLDRAMRAVTGQETVLPLSKFVAGVMMEFRFERRLRMDVHLRALYASLEGADEDTADYRELLACLRLLHMRKDIYERPLHVLLALLAEFEPTGFSNDTYACCSANSSGSWEQGSLFDSSSFVGGTGGAGVEADNRRGSSQLSSPTPWAWRRDVLRVASLAAVTENDVARSASALDRALSVAAPSHGLKPRCRRVPLPLLLESFEADAAVLLFCRELMWARLPAEWRLNILAETEDLRFRKLAAPLEARKLRRALAWRARNVLRRCFRAWGAFLDGAQADRQRYTSLAAEVMRRSLRRWHVAGASAAISRRQRQLAAVCGRRAVLRRRLRALRRYAVTAMRIRSVCRRLSVTGKHVAAGVGHLRAFLRLRRLRLLLRRWREEARLQVAWDLACEVWRARVSAKHFTAWHETAAAAVAAAAAEREAEARAAALRETVRRASEDRRAAEAAALVLAAEQKAALKRKVMEERAYTAKMARQREAARAKAKDTAIRERQREERRKRAAEDAERRIREFDEEWKKRGEEAVALAVQHARELLSSDDREAEYLIEKEFKETKRRFLAPPRPEDDGLERSLQDPANVIFARVTHRLFLRGQTLREFFLQFDASGDGFLSHEEFRGLVHSLGLEGLSGEQIHAVLRSVDVDGSGFIDLPELEAAMANHEAVCGTPGSPWKMYVHPIHAVMTFHNVQTDEEIWDYRATDLQLRAVCLDALVGKEEVRARAKASAARDADWEARRRDWAARVLQRGQRRWKAQRQRELRGWRADGERLRERKRRDAAAAATLQRAWRCTRARRHALLALGCCVEKCSDPRTLALFYFNHATRESSWKPPRILRRLRGPGADLPGPGEWAAVVRPQSAEGALQLEVGGGGSSATATAAASASSYWFNTLTGEVREPGAAAPEGHLVCGGCGVRPAAKACRKCQAPKPLCFLCFRAQHVADLLPHGLRHEAKEVRPCRCRACNAHAAERVCADCSMPPGSSSAGNDDFSIGYSSGGVPYCERCWQRTHRAAAVAHRSVQLDEWLSQQLVARQNKNGGDASAAAMEPHYDDDGKRLPDDADWDADAAVATEYLLEYGTDGTLAATATEQEGQQAAFTAEASSVGVSLSSAGAAEAGAGADAAALMQAASDNGGGGFLRDYGSGWDAQEDGGTTASFGVEAPLPLEAGLQ